MEFVGRLAVPITVKMRPGMEAAPSNIVPPKNVENAAEPRWNDLAWG